MLTLYANLFGFLPDFVTSKLLGLVMAAVPVGAISFALYQFVKRQSAFVDSITNPWTHRGLVTATAFLVTTVATALNVPIVCPEGLNCLNELTQDRIELLVKAGLSAVAAFVLHANKDSKKRK